MGDYWKKWYKFEGDEDRFDFFIFILLKPFSIIFELWESNEVGHKHLGGHCMCILHRV
jgi:hypothetical protein